MAEIDFAISTKDDPAKLADELEALVGGLYRGIARNVLPPIERELARRVDQHARAYPPPRTRASRRFVHSNDPVRNARARRWFFANYPNGYKRTNRLKRVWIGEIVVTYAQGLKIVVDVRNESEAASYVYGSPAHDYKQVPGHAHTGWYNAGVTIPNLIVLPIAERIERDVTEYVDEQVARID